jgi:hypothetical protein
MGLEGKPNNIKQSIIEASRGSEAAQEILSKAGHKSAKNRAENLDKKKSLEEYEYDKIYQGQLEYLMRVYPEMNYDGEPATDEWYDAEAKGLAKAIVKMRKMQKDLGKK